MKQKATNIKTSTAASGKAGNTLQLLKQREAELNLVNSIQEGLVSQLDIQEIYDLVGDKIRDIFDAQVTGIYSFDKSTDTENFHYLFEDGERLYPDPRPLNQIRKWIIKNKKLLLVNSDADNQIFKITGEKHVAVPGTRLPKSLIFVPLLVGDEVKGCVSLQNLDKENAFTEADVRLLSTLANSMSVALENVRLFDETEQRNAELAVINSVQQGLVAEMDIQGIYDLVGEKIRNLFNAQAVIIATFNLENKTEDFKYIFEDGQRVFSKPRPYDKIRQRLIKTKNLINIEENTEEAYTTITGEPPKSVPGTKFAQSMVFVPLLVGEHVRGYVSLQNVDIEYAFSDADVRLLSTLANSMSVALENARLFNETEQRNAELAVINSVQEGLVAEMDMQGIYDLVGERVRQLFDAEVIAIVTLNLEEQKEHFQYAFEEGERIYPSNRKYDKIREKIIKGRAPLLISENAAKKMSEINGKPFKPVPGTRLPKSALFVPMIVGDSVRGYVTLQNNDREHAFSEADVRLLSTLANSMSVALENARLFNETEQRNAELAVINSVQEGLVAEMDMQGIYDLVGDKIRDLFEAQVTGVVTFNREEKTEYWAYLFEEGDRLYHNPRKYDKIREKIIREKSILNISENAAQILSEIKGETIQPVPGTRLAKSALYVPMIVGDSVRGYVTLQNNDRENAFSEADVRLLSTLANSMSVALENARLFNETEQRNAELAVINSVQEGLVAEMDMQGIYDLVGDKIRDLFDAQVTAVATFNYENSSEELHYIFEDGQRYESVSRPINKLRQYLIDSQQLLYIRENADKEWEKITGESITSVPGTKKAKCLLFVPMMVGKEVRGYVSLQNLDKENAFSDNDVRLLNTLVNSMSVALENARLFNETEQRNAELAVINSVQEGLVAEMDMQGIYDLVGDKIRDLFEAQVTAVATFNYENNTEEFHYLFEDGQNFEMSSRPIDKFRRHLIDTQELVCINENADEVWTQLTGEVPTVVPGTQFTKSALFVPMLVGKEVRGYVSLQNLDKENAFSDNDVRLLNTLVNSMSVALENARLFNETEQRNAELAVINSVQEGLVAEMDMQGIYDLVGDKIRKLFDAQVTAVATFNYENSTEEFHYIFEDGRRFEGGARPLDKIRQRLIDTQQLLYINENADEEWTKITGEKIVAVPGTKNAKSLLFVPMLVGKEVRGYVSLQNLDKENAFSDNDVRLLNTLVNSMSVALENARLFNETEQRNAELAVINSVQEGLVAEMDMQGIYDLVGDRIRDLFDAQVTVIRTFNHKKGIESYEYAYEKGKRLKAKPQAFIWNSKLLIENKEPLLIKDHYKETAKKYGGKGIVKGQEPKSVVFVPMIVGNKVMGSVSLQNIDRENAYSESDVQLLTTLTRSMSMALNNARLFNKTNRLLEETEQRNAELAVINSVQEGLVAEMDMQGIYDLVGNRLRDLFDAQAVVIATLIPENKEEVFNFIYENGARHYPKPRPYNELRQQLIESKELICINKNASKSANLVPGTKSPKSMIFVPLIIADTVNGYISLQNIDKENAFDSSDIRLLSTLANSMTVTLENARLFNETTRLLGETEQYATEMQTVNNISRALVAQLEFDALMKLVGEQMKDTFKADIVYLAIHDTETNMLHFPYYYGDTPHSRPFGNGITEKIIINQEPILINQNVEEAYNTIKAEKLGTMVESYLGVPIISGKKSIGVISVQSTEHENRFNENDLRLLTTIAANLGIAMQNAEAYRKLQAALIDLKSAQEQLVQQEKLASLGQLAAGIAHEIKNPLNFVNNFSELNTELIDEVFEELPKLGESKAGIEIKEILQDIKSNLKKIHQHGTRADSIVKSMLQHSRGGSGKILPTNINELLKEYVNLSFHGMRAGKKAINVSIDLQLNEEVGTVPLISEDFSRVVLNLCNNAFDAMWEKKHSSAGQGYAPKLTISTKPENSKVMVKIEDNGPGIPPRLKDKIMQPFFTTKKGTEGTGLGLSITNDIIKAHGGTLNIESKTGTSSYTRFEILLTK